MVLSPTEVPPSSASGEAAHGAVDERAAQRWIRHLAALGPFGYSPLAPGTVGTLPGVLLWVLLAPRISWPLHLAACVLVTAVSSVVAHYAGKAWGAADAGPIVIDELAGTLWTFLLVPPGLGWAAAGFLGFRLFDITKPWPARYFDRKVKNGFGVTMDDVCAGWYACAVLHLLHGLGLG